jgi:hypothetical protein
MNSTKILGIAAVLFVMMVVIVSPASAYTMQTASAIQSGSTQSINVAGNVNLHAYGVCQSAFASQVKSPRSINLAGNLNIGKQFVGQDASASQFKSKKSVNTGLNINL